MHVVVVGEQRDDRRVDVVGVRCRRRCPGPVAGRWAGEVRRVALARLPAFVNGADVLARRRWSGSTRPSAGRERADAPTAPVSALLPVVVVGRRSRPPITSHGSGVARRRCWRSSNVHGAAGAAAGREAADDPAVGARRRSSGGLFVKYFQFGWSAARVEPVDAAQHGAGLGVDEHGPGRAARGRCRRRWPRTRGGRRRRSATATSRTCWSGSRPPTRSWPKPARAPRTDTAPASTPTLRAAARQASWRGQPPGALERAAPAERRGGVGDAAVRRCRRPACRRRRGSPPTRAAEAARRGRRSR